MFVRLFPPVPPWGTVCIGLLALLILLCCCGCLCRMCWKRRKGKDMKKGLKGAVDLKSVQLLGSAMKEKVAAIFITGPLQCAVTTWSIHNIGTVSVTCRVTVSVVTGRLNEGLDVLWPFNDRDAPEWATYVFTGSTPRSVSIIYAAYTKVVF